MSLTDMFDDTCTIYIVHNINAISYYFEVAKLINDWRLAFFSLQPLFVNIRQLQSHCKVLLRIFFFFLMDKQTFFEP